MAGNQFSLEERKFVLKCYWKTENAIEVQRRFRRKFARPPPTRRTIACIKEKFEADGTVQNVNKKRSGRPRTSTSPGKKEQVQETLSQSPQKSLRETARETNISKDSVHRIMKCLHLDAAFPDTWIGRRGAIEYPARSPDLTPMDFFLWDISKTKFIVPNQEQLMH